MESEGGVSVRDGSDWVSVGRVGGCRRECDVTARMAQPLVNAK